MATFKVLRLATGKIRELGGTDQGNINSVLLNAGTTAQAPLVFTPTGANLLTTAIAGAMEIDTLGVLYYSQAASSRGAIESAQFISLTSAYTLVSQTAAQKLFNSSTNGAISVTAGTSYYFECEFNLTAVSATSNAGFGFAFGGTATLTSQAWTAMAVKSTAATATAPALTFNTAANISLCVATVGTGGTARIRGIVRINAAGTLIPQVSLITAAAAIVSVNSYFRIWPVGSNTVTTLGNWS